MARIDQKASRTAMFAAIYRYMATKEANPAFRGPDHLAQLFLPARVRFYLRFPAVQRNACKKVPGTYEYVVARTKFFDWLFRDALEDNIPQIVLLGAGYDTRAIRFRDSIQQTRVFELDAPFSQREKRRYLQKQSIDLPSQLCFAPIDFGKQSLEQALLGAGYDRTKKSFFLWEGVTYYLTEETVRGTLRFIKENSGPGSTVAFDYFYKSAVEGKSRHYGAKQLLASGAKFGEPFLSGIAEGEIEQFLSESGFDILAHYTPAEFEDAFLRDDSGAILGKMYGFACHVHARARD